MLTFDKLKIVIKSSKHIDNINTNKFNTIIKDDVITEYRYSQTTPYLLYIEQDIIEDEVVIEFTGKILGADYPNLINRENIRQCLDNINALGICTLDVDGILNYGEVVKADVTKDIEYENDISTLTTEMMSCIKNYKRYEATFDKGNFTIRIKNKTPNRQLRLVLYDKEKEMSLMDNQRWIASLGDAAAHRINEYFRGKIRFEMNLNSIKAIKDGLCLRDNSISSVLNAETNPIMPFLDKVLLDNAEARVAKSVHDFERITLMEKFGNDMKAIERAILPYKSPKTNLSQIMKPYHQLFNALNSNNSTSIKEKLKNALLEIFLIGFFVSI